jgi:hypothetical protein
VPEQTPTNQFHDSENGDIFDLYSACNGELHDGLLDIGQLDEFSEEECAALNVARLREIWIHTASGCSQCEEIVQILNSARGMLSDKKEPCAERVYDLSTAHAFVH